MIVMTLNPFFLQGSTTEQFLIQDLINEQLKIYGIEIYYLPRKIFKTDNIIEEIQSSKFDDSFLIEAYLNNYDGYAPGSDLMTKFGLRLQNEVSLTISKERFEEFIAPFLEGISSGIREGRITEYDFADLITRPKEGDLIYFPLGERLFEIKRVESEKPFYQLGRNYIYELQCELYEYENELIDTSIEEVDNTVEDEGYISTITLVGTARTATADAVGIVSGFVKEIFLNNDGSGYSGTPIITFSSPPSGGSRAEAVAITTSIGGIRSIKEILLTSTGSNYETAPTITITGGGGTGAAATCSISTSSSKGLFGVSITDGGRGYNSSPTVTVSPPTGFGAIATATSGGAIGSITSLNLVTGGEYYISTPSVVISNPSVRTGVLTEVYLSDSGGNPVASVGSGYTDGFTYDCSPGSGASLVRVLVSVNDSGAVVGVPTVVYGGFGYNNGLFQLDGGDGSAYVYGTGIGTASGITATGIASISGGIVTSLTITNPGYGYTQTPQVSIANSASIKGGVGIVTATAVSIINANSEVSSIRMVNPGLGYTTNPTITIENPSAIGISTFTYNEVVTGQTSGITARVRDFREYPGAVGEPSTVLLRVSLNTGMFYKGETIIGSASSATWVVDNHDANSYDDPYDTNEEIESEADDILDFTETNPFGEY